MISKIANFFKKLFNKGKDVASRLINSGNKESTSNNKNEDLLLEFKWFKHKKKENNTVEKSNSEDTSNDRKVKSASSKSFKIKGHAFGSYPLFTKKGLDQLVGLVLKPMQNTQLYIHKLQKDTLTNISVEKLNNLKSKDIPVISKKIESIAKTMEKVGETTASFTN